MENLKEYIDFINSCRTKLYEGKTHSHHILPRFMGGCNEYENLIDLSYEDHQTAHFILANCFPKHSSEWKGNINAVNVLQVFVKNPDWDISGENHPRYGDNWSIEAKNQIAASVKKYYEDHPEHGKEKLRNRDISGEKNGMYGQGHKVAGEKNGRFGGKGTTDITRQKISQSKLGVPLNLSEESRMNMRIRSGGINNGMYGTSAYKIWIEKYGQQEADRRREETNKLKGLKNKGKPKSQETRERMRISALNRKKTVEAQQ